MKEEGKKKNAADEEEKEKEEDEEVERPPKNLGKIALFPFLLMNPLFIH